MLRSGYRIAMAACLVAMLLAVVAPAQGVLLNEVFTGNPDFFEITNFTGSVVNLGGWQIDCSFATTIYATYTFPTGITINPGESIVVIESMSALPASSPPPPAGTQILNTGIGYGWVGSSEGCVVLVDNSAVVVDMCLFGNAGTATLPPSATGQIFTNSVPRTNNGDAIFRISSIDTDDGMDWMNDVAGMETPGVLNPGQTLLAQNVDGIGFDPTTGFAHFDTMAGTVTINATISEIFIGGGLILTDPAVDSLIGGTLSITGNYSGNPANLAGMLFTPASITVDDAPMTDGLFWSNIFSSTAYQGFSLGGPLGARVVQQHEMSSNPAFSVTQTGAGSLAVQSLVTSLTQDNFSMLFELTTTLPRLRSLVKNFTPPASTPLESAFVTDGMGAFQLGVINGSGNEIYNIFAMNPISAPGMGPAFGIDFGTFQIAQFALPLGTAPFHVLPDANGNYQFTSPMGIVPGGMVLDVVTLDLNATGTFDVAGPHRVTF